MAAFSFDAMHCVAINESPITDNRNLSHQTHHSEVQGLHLRADLVIVESQCLYHIKSAKHSSLFM